MLYYDIVLNCRVQILNLMNLLITQEFFFRDFLQILYASFGV